MKRVYQFLKECGTYYLATTDGNQPRVRPFGTVDIFDGRLCFQTGKSKEVSKQIHTNPKIEICACNAAGNRWIRIAGSAFEETRQDAQVQMLNAYPELKRLYQPGDGNTEIFYLVNAEAVIYSFTEKPVTIQFG